MTHALGKVDAAFVFLKKEKRGRRSSPYRRDRSLRGVLRFDRDLTGPIYVLKSTGRFISRQV